jgi:hypothetical protein
MIPAFFYYVYILPIWPIQTGTHIGVIANHERRR